LPDRRGSRAAGFTSEISASFVAVVHFPRYLCAHHRAALPQVRTAAERKAGLFLDGPACAAPAEARNDLREELPLEDIMLFKIFYDN